MQKLNVQFVDRKNRKIYSILWGIWGDGGVDTFICCVDRRPTSTTAVRAFHHTTVLEEQARWWVLERDLGASRRRLLPNTVLVLRSDLLQVAIRTAR